MTDKNNWSGWYIYQILKIYISCYYSFSLNYATELATLYTPINGKDAIPYNIYLELTKRPIP